MNLNELSRIIEQSKEPIRVAQSLNFPSIPNNVQQAIKNNQEMLNTMSRINVSLPNLNQYIKPNIQFANSSVILKPYNFPKIVIPQYTQTKYFQDIASRQSKLIQDSLKRIFDLIDNFSTLEKINISNNLRHPIKLDEVTNENDIDINTLNQAYQQMQLHWESYYDPTSSDNIKFIVSSAYFDLSNINKNKYIKTTNKFLGSESLSIAFEGSINYFYHHVTGDYLSDSALTAANIFLTLLFVLAIKIKR